MQIQSKLEEMDGIKKGGVWKKERKPLLRINKKKKICKLNYKNTLKEKKCYMATEIPGIVVKGW